jgi:hypothetical protein
MPSAIDPNQPMDVNGYQVKPPSEGQSSAERTGLNLTGYGQVNKGLEGSAPVERFATNYHANPGYDQARGMLMSQLGQGGYTPQQVGPAFADGRPQDQVRNQQMMLAQALQRQAAGQGPSLAQMQLQQGTDRNLQQALAFASSQRGVNPALAARQAGMNQANIGQQAVMQSGMLRQQEMMDAQNALGGLYGQMRGADIGVSQFNAGQAQQAQLANQQAGLQGQQLNNQAFLQQMGMLTGLDQQQLQNRIGQEQFNADLLARQIAAENGVAMQTAQNNTQMAGAGIGAGAALLGSLAMMSDENQKTDIRDGSGEVRDFLSALGTHSYEYKDGAKENPTAGHGRFVSPMAQEIERTTIGKSMVNVVGGTKVVDYGKGFGAMLAAMADMHKRLEKIGG